MVELSEVRRLRQSGFDLADRTEKAISDLYQADGVSPKYTDHFQRATRIYADMDAERRLINDALQAIIEGCEEELQSAAKLDLTQLVMDLSNEDRRNLPIISDQVQAATFVELKQRLMHVLQKRPQAERVLYAYAVDAKIKSTPLDATGERLGISEVQRLLPRLTVSAEERRQLQWDKLDTVKREAWQSKRLVNSSLADVDARTPRQKMVV